MFQSIVKFAVRRKLFVALTTLFLFLGGLYAMLTLPVDAVPDITNNQVQIVTISPTLAPQEVEQLITIPVETSMSHIMNVEEIRSVSRFGLSLVTVVFKESVPTLQARQLINEQIQNVAAEIPQENTNKNTLFFTQQNRADKKCLSAGKPRNRAQKRGDIVTCPDCVFSHPDCNCRLRNWTESAMERCSMGRGLYRR